MSPQETVRNGRSRPFLMDIDTGISVINVKQIICNLMMVLQ